ncbi:aminoglycoside phosphotransferase [Lysinibacillus sp. 2017]|uniref:aminoglycoside phosphotransferase family protein n=1 Tax=unclassified Lysinibacillus TaxID=2636778 RepID=UPI000D52778E|nr:MULTISPECIES: aminoglycoside phosphotransferase family protein [unclassified Lysinibacillus]AWE07287.1 aminoglycoside phosphotransferase [Lysinibacillus sp. 2017]TGN30806.1 aminoglycoside phosphotransferase family protein [Lysinibacillus sp. S2017]
MNLGTPIAIGNTAQIYLYENKIIKVFNDFLPDTESSYEANKQKYAYSCGLSVPKIFDVTTIDGKQAIIMEFVKGKTIGNLLLENMDQAEYYMNISIEIQQKIHRIEADSLEPMSLKLHRQIESALDLDTRQKNALLQKMDTITYKKRLCHGDFHMFNLIMSDNQQVTIIDWVDSSAGDLRADVYRTYLLYEQFSVQLAEMYLRLYCQKSGLSKEDIFQWAPIIAGARLSENVSSEKNERLMEIVNQYCPL